jgi:protein gp37
MVPAWARSIRDQCIAASVPFFFKQWGEYAPAHIMQPGFGAVDSGLGYRSAMARVGKHKSGRLLDGREWNEFPKTPRASAATSEAV